jgi:hypothetical protein
MLFEMLAFVKPTIKKKRKKKLEKEETTPSLLPQMNVIF